MTKSKLLATGLAAVVGVLFVAGDASAFGKRKRNRGGGCNDCGGGYVSHGGYGGHQGGCGDCGGGSAYAPQGDCGGCGSGYATAPGYAVPVAGAPQAMPAPGVATNPETQPGTVTPAAGTEGGVVTPAGGTTVQPGTVVPQSYVVPGGGYYQGGRYVYPAGGYYQNGQYVTPAGYGSIQTGFGAGVLQGAAGTTYSTPYGNTIGGTVGNYAGQQVGRGLFRRR